MFLAVTVLLTLLEISFSRRHPRRRHNRPRPRQSKRLKGGRTGRNDPSFHDTHEYLGSYSYQDSSGSDGHSYGGSYSVECDEQEYDCGNSGELPSIIVEPPRPATTKRPATTRRPAPTPAPATTRRPAPTPAPCQRPWIRLATGCYRFQIKSPSPFTF